MENTATRRRAQSLSNTNKDPSDDRKESRQHHGGIVRRKSVSELVARYQNVMDIHSSQKEEKVQDGSAQKKTAKMDLLKNKSEDCHVQNKDFARSKYEERDNSQRMRTININRNLHVTSGTTQVNGRVQHKTGPAQTEKTQLFSGTKLNEAQHKTSVTKRYETLECKYRIEPTTSTKDIVLKERHTISKEVYRIKKESESAGRKVSETRVQALPEALNGSTNRKHYRKALPHLEHLEEAQHIHLKGLTRAVPSVKERSALYLSKAAATSKVRPKESQRATEDTASVNNNSQLKKHVSAAREICPVCFKPVYSMERMVLDKVVLHQTCFLCKHCNKKLSLHNYGVYRGNVYCKDHHSLLTKAKESSIESLNGKLQKEHQLNKPGLSNLGTDIRGQHGQEKPNFHKMENAERKQNKDLQGDKKLFSQSRKLGGVVSSHADPEKKLRIHWPPLQTPIKDFKSHNNRLVTIQCPSINIGRILQTNKIDPFKLASTTNKPPMGQSMTENYVGRHTISVSNVPFSTEDSSILAKNASGDGKRTLQQLTQKLKSHNGNIARAKVGNNGRKLVEDNSVFKNTNRILSPATKVSFSSLSPHLRILKVTKPTNPKPVTKIKSGLSVSSDGSHINTEYMDCLTPSSNNTLITLNQQVMYSSLLKMDPKPDPTAVLAGPLPTLEKRKEDKADVDNCKNGSVNVQKDSALFAYSGSDHIEEIDCVSQPCQPVTCAPTVQGTCGRTNGNTFLPDIMLVSDVRAEESGRLNLSTVTKAVDIAIDDPEVINKENDILSNTKHLTQNETNVKVGDLLLSYEVSTGTENNQLHQSNTLEIDKYYVEHIHQETPTEKNKDLHTLEPNCSNICGKESYQQEMDCSDSGNTLNQKPPQKHRKQIGLTVIPRDNELQPSSANLRTIGSSLLVTTSAGAQPGMPPNADHATFQTYGSSKMQEATNIQKHASEKKIAESTHSLASISKRDMLVFESPPGTERCDVTEQNRERQPRKEQFIKPTGFDKNPFSRLFPLDVKDSKLKKEIAGNKRVSVAKTQSALGKIFGLSAGTLKKEQILETERLPQKPSDGNSKFEGRPSLHYTGLEDTKDPVTTPKEKNWVVTNNERTQEESKKLEERCQESQIVDPFGYAECQTGHVPSKGLPQFKCNRILEPEDSTKYAGPENSSHTQNEYERPNPPEMIQCPTELQTDCQDQTKSKSEQMKDSQNRLSGLLDGGISSEPIIPHSGPGIIETDTTSQRRQIILQSENKRTSPLDNGHAEALVLTNTTFDQLRNNERKEPRFYSDQINLQGDEMPILLCNFERNVLVSDINDPGTYEKNFETPSSANVYMLQPRDQQYLHSGLGERSESPLHVNDVAPLLCFPPHLVTASGTPCDTDIAGMPHERDITCMPHDPDTIGMPSESEGTNNVLNTALMDQSDAEFQDPSDHNDLYG